MAAEPPTELETFHRFLTDQLAGGRSDLSPEESVKAFRAYQRELERLKKEIAPAVERSKRGESRELDFEAIKDEVTQRLAQRGITD